MGMQDVDFELIYQTGKDSTSYRDIRYQRRDVTR